MLFNPSTADVRRFFCDAWQRARQGLPCEPAQSIAAQWCLEHPEYHRLLDASEQAIDKDFHPDAGRENPFLHLSLHLALEEQIGADQPPGIRKAWQDLLGRCDGNRHQAAHQGIECLGRVLWEAQRRKSMPDTEAYLACLRRA
ncbi:MAG: DUF1841 family protein [Betaproteobacteria bacterium]|nr:DUF1841 family protein [Betaproteobacteria bacterium]